MIEILIQHGNTLFSPPVLEGVTWQTERKGSPGKLEFKIVFENSPSAPEISEGDIVRFSDGKDNIFYGYIFRLQKSKDKIVTVTAYDQLRYFKNKDTYVYENKTADSVLKMVCGDFSLKCGTIESTPYKIPSRIEENKSLFEIVQNALDLTIQNKKAMYVLYDDFGKIMLKSLASMKTNIMIDEETGENFDYTSSIDDNTYNRVKLTYDNEETGKREVYTASNSRDMAKWGILQYFDTLQKDENGKAKAAALLSLYDAKTKRLSIKNAFGSNAVRAGSMVLVKLNLRDMKLQNLMLVEKCRHEYKHEQHLMSLELRGGEFQT